MTAWTITGPRDAGITVSDLDRSLAFDQELLGLELLWRRLCLYSLDPVGYVGELHERPPR